MRISDWSSDVCSSDLTSVAGFEDALKVQAGVVGNIDGARTAMSNIVGASQSATGALQAAQAGNQLIALQSQQIADLTALVAAQGRAQALEAARDAATEAQGREQIRRRSEETTSEHQSLMRITYADFCM